MLWFAPASCDHQKSKLLAVAVAERFWVAELRVRQFKIGRKSCFGDYSKNLDGEYVIFILF